MTHSAKGYAVPFFLDYLMMTGPGRREALTADEAIEAFRLIQAAGGGTVIVTDHTGKNYQFGDLLRLTRPKRNSDGNFSA